MRLNRDTRGLFDVADAIDSNHPDNAGLTLLFSAPPGTSGGAGGRYQDLVNGLSSATLSGGASWVPGQDAVSLGGASQYLSALALPAANSTITVAYTFQLSALPTSTAYPNRYFGMLRAVNGSIFNYGTIHDSARLIFQWSTASNVFVSAIANYSPDLLPHRLVCTANWRTGRYAIYLDGLPLSLSSSPGVSTPQTTGGVFVGTFGRHPLATEYFRGRIGNIRVHIGTEWAADAAARDYQWSRDQGTDPRLRGIIPRSYQVVTYGTDPVSVSPPQLVRQRPFLTDTTSAVHSDNPDNTNTLLLLCGLPGTSAGAGNKFPDLGRRTNGATLVAGPPWVGTPFGQVGLSLNGSGQYADLGTSVQPLQPVGPFTVAAWFRTTATGQQEIYGSYSQNPNHAGFLLGVSVTGAAAGKLGLFSGRNNGVTLGTNSQVVNGATTVSDGQWHRGVGVWDGTKLLVYVDGRLDASTSWAFSPGYAATTYCRVGGSVQGSSATPFGYFNGSVAGVGLWGRAFDAAWVARDFIGARDPIRDPRLSIRSTRDYSGLAPTDFFARASRRKIPLFDTVNSIDRDHPASNKLVTLLMAPPGSTGGAGNRLPDLAGSTPGVLTNGPVWVGSDRGVMAIRFDGVNDWVRMGQPPVLGNSYSFACTFKTQSITRSMAIFAARSSINSVPVTFQLDIINATVRAAVRGDNNVAAIPQSASLVSIGVPYRLLGVRSDNIVTVYLNGVAAATVTAPSSIGTITSNRMDIGAGVVGTDAPTSPFVGDVTDAWVWNRPLSPAEIFQDYLWSRDFTTDPRLRLASPKSYLTPLGQSSIASWGLLAIG